MVRVGGGWSALEEFLAKNDPCRGMSNSCHSFFVLTLSVKKRLTRTSMLG